MTRVRLWWRVWMLVRTTLRPIPSCESCGMPKTALLAPSLDGGRRVWQCLEPECVAQQTCVLVPATMTDFEVAALFSRARREVRNA